MLTVIKYQPKHYTKWQDFICRSNNGTLFHRLDFLSYHQNRFTDHEHHLMWFKGQEIAAVMPMGIFVENGQRVAKSPFGASYGGIVTATPPNYYFSYQLISALVAYLKSLSIDEIRITLPIRACYRNYCETLEFSLLHHHFSAINSDISSIVPLNQPDLENNIFTSRARNMARKARALGVTTQFRQSPQLFWILMQKTFDKHKVPPTHSQEEWFWLCEHLPNDIWCDIAFLEDQPIAGIGHFKINSLVDSAFYLCSDPDHQQSQALSLLLYEAILKATSDGYATFDFGTSTVQMIPRENIFRFKES
jgi:hypothetical protein